MELSTLYVVLGFFLLLILLFILALLYLLNHNKTYSVSLTETNQKLMELVTTQNNLIQSKGPMEFQALQAMTYQTSSSEPIGMSDMEEAERWAAAQGVNLDKGDVLYDPDGANALQQLYGPNSS